MIPLAAMPPFITLNPPPELTGYWKCCVTGVRSVGRWISCVFSPNTIHPYELMLSQIRRRGPGSPPNRYPRYVLNFCPKLPPFNLPSSSDGLHQPERAILGWRHCTGKGNNPTKKPTNHPADHLDRQLVPVCGSEGVPVPHRGENPDNL